MHSDAAEGQAPGKDERRPRDGPPNPLPPRQGTVQAAQGQIRNVRASAARRGPRWRSPRASPDPAPRRAAFADGDVEKAGGQCSRAEPQPRGVKDCPPSCPRPACILSWNTALPFRNQQGAHVLAQMRKRCQATHTNNRN